MHARCCKHVHLARTANAVVRGRILLPLTHSCAPSFFSPPVFLFWYNCPSTLNRLSDLNAIEKRQFKQHRSTGSKKIRLYFAKKTASTELERSSSELGLRRWETLAKGLERRRSYLGNLIVLLTTRMEENSLHITCIGNAPASQLFASLRAPRFAPIERGNEAEDGKRQEARIGKATRRSETSRRAGCLVKASVHGSFNVEKGNGARRPAAGADAGGKNLGARLVPDACRGEGGRSFFRGSRFIPHWSTIGCCKA